MKKLFKTLTIMVATVMAVSCRLTAKTPIKMETTKIVYTSYTNSGTAIATKMEITRDSLVRDRRDYRQGHHERTGVEIDSKDFDELVRLLSAISFKVKHIDDASAGGDGWAYSFETEKGRYMYFNSHDKLSGQYEDVIQIITRFLENHPIQKNETESKP